MISEEPSARPEEDVASRSDRSAGQDLTNPANQAAVSSFLASFVHRMSQPVTALLGTLQVAMLKARSPADYQSVFAEAVELTEQIARLIRLLGELAIPRNTTVGEESIPLGQVMEEVAEDLRPWAESRGVRMANEGLGGISVKANAQRLRVALMKVLFNAVQRSPRDGTVRATLSSCDGEAVISVTDEGRSLSADEAAAILNPFGKSRPRIPKLEETHLEWAIAAQIIHQMQGLISLDSAVPRGCCCRIRFPLEPHRAASTPAEVNSCP